MKNEKRWSPLAIIWFCFMFVMQWLAFIEYATKPITKTNVAYQRATIIYGIAGAIGTILYLWLIISKKKSALITIMVLGGINVISNLLQGNVSLALFAGVYPIITFIVSNKKVGLVKTKELDKNTNDNHTISLQNPFSTTTNNLPHYYSESEKYDSDVQAHKHAIYDSMSILNFQKHFSAFSSVHELGNGLTSYKIKDSSMLYLVNKNIDKACCLIDDLNTVITDTSYVSLYDLSKTHHLCYVKDARDGILLLYSMERSDDKSNKQLELYALISQEGELLVPFQQIDSNIDDKFNELKKKIKE